MLTKLYPIISRINTIRNISMTAPLKFKQYLPTGDWLKRENNIIKIGLSLNTIMELSEINYIDYNFNKDDKILKDEEIVILESNKCIASINAPFDCILIKNNNKLIDNLDLLNEDCECEDNGWIIKIKET